MFEDFRYTDELAGDGVHGLLFEARVGERSLQASTSCDRTRTARSRSSPYDPPGSGLIALAERMGPALHAAGVR